VADEATTGTIECTETKCSAYNFVAGVVGSGASPCRNGEVLKPHTNPTCGAMCKEGYEEDDVTLHCTTEHGEGEAPHNQLSCKACDPIPHCESGLNCRKGEASICNRCELGFYGDGTSECKQCTGIKNCKPHSNGDSAVFCTTADDSFCTNCGDYKFFDRDQFLCDWCPQVPKCTHKTECSTRENSLCFSCEVGYELREDPLTGGSVCAAKWAQAPCPDGETGCSQPHAPTKMGGRVGAKAKAAMSLADRKAQMGRVLFKESQKAGASGHSALASAKRQQELHSSHRLRRR